MAHITRFYQWLYYRCYRYSKKAGDSKFVVHWANAAIYALLLLSMNLIVLLFLLVFLSPTTFAMLFSANRWIVGAAFLSLVALQISILGHNARYKKIVSVFEAETTEQQRRGDRLFGWYLTISIFVLLGTFVIAATRAGFN